MPPHRLIVFLFAAIFLFSGLHPVAAQTPTAGTVVHAVLFYSPSCGHCAYVINEVLPPLFDHYGNQLQMIGIDVTQPDGQALFLTTLQTFAVERGAVPFLVVGDTYLIGSVDIPEQFPALIEQGLAQGGVDWPDIPGLMDLLNAVTATQDILASPTPPTPTLPLATPSLLPNTPVPDPQPAPTAETFILTGEAHASLADRLALDPLGNGLAIIVLVGMLVSLGWGGWHFWRTPGRRLSKSAGWVVLALCIIGLGVAGYLAFIELTHTEAFCGPVGDCNTVQQSKYARLFGILPIGLLGIIGYVMILVSWGLQQFFKGKSSDLAALLMLVMTTFGTFFSVYLTFLEPFVIGATCAWCLASAVLMTILMLFSIAPGKLALVNLKSEFPKPDSDSGAESSPGT